MPSPWWPVAILVTVGAVFAILNRRVTNAIGRSANRFASSDTAHDFIGRVYRVAGAILFAFLMLRALWPSADVGSGRILWLAHPLVGWLGLALIVIGSTVIVAAERQMGASWRIGIGAERTQLITAGLFTWSRNPTFLGMLTSLAGIFLAEPTVVTGAVLAAAWVAFSVQVRMEEEHLQVVHGHACIQYRAEVPRWIGRSGRETTQ